MKTIREKAACRVDLAGGTVDLWPLYLYLGGLELVNMGIDLQAQAEVRWAPARKKKSPHVLHINSLDLKQSQDYSSLEELKASLHLSSPENPLRWINRLVAHFLSVQASRSAGEWWIETSYQAPPGSGLGGSSTMGIALSRALMRALGSSALSTPARWALQQRIRDLEAIEIEHPAGDQDYVPALFGGLLVFRLNAQTRSVERLPPKTGRQVSDRLALIYTGKPHHSGLNNWSVFKAFHDGDRSVKKSLLSIRDISSELAAELRLGSLKKLASLVDSEWEERQRLSPAVQAPVLEEAWTFAKKEGAEARKACGAGGGGCLLLVFPDKESKSRALKTTLPSPHWKWLSADISKPV